MLSSLGNLKCFKKSSKSGVLLKIGSSLLMLMNLFTDRNKELFGIGQSVSTEPIVEGVSKKHTKFAFK